MTFKVLALAFFMVVFNSALLIGNEMDVFGSTPGYVATEFNRDSWEPNVEVPATGSGEDEGSESLIRRGLTMVFGSSGTTALGFFDSLKDVIFLGSTVDQTMEHGFGIGLPDSIKTALNGFSSFVYSLAAIQLFLRFRIE